MKTNLNLPLKQLTLADLKDIKLIAFDCDGVTVEKGTEFIHEHGQTVIETHSLSSYLASRIKNLVSSFYIVFTSGRSMSYLQKMYSSVLSERVFLQSEIGMFTCMNNNITQNYFFSESEKQSLDSIYSELEKLSSHPSFKGFEPKDQIITLHTHEYIPEVEKIVKKFDPEGQLFCWWNGEAFDIGSKSCSKGTGLKLLADKLNLQMSNIMTVGNGINDVLMTDVTGLDISTDPKHLKADFQVAGEHLGGQAVVEKILSLI